MTARRVVIVILLAAVSACTETRYRPVADTPAQSLPFARDVYFELRDAFYENPPRCALVLPSEAPVSPALAGLVERSLARHLSEKVAHVIGPEARQRLERRLALDAGVPDGRARLSAETRCETALEWALLAARTEHFVVWSRREIGIEAVLVRGSTELWRARHTAHRSEGGLPLSLLSLPIAAAEASLFYADADQTPSEIDDVVRRMFVTLPDAR